MKSRCSFAAAVSPAPEAISCGGQSEILTSIPETLHLSIKIYEAYAEANIHWGICVCDLSVQFRAIPGDSPDLFGKLRTRSFQGLAYDSRRRVVANSADVGNG
jgi:hypothetical protein